RGRNAKQEPAVEAVPETTTAEEEANQQAPPTDAVQSDAAAAIPAVPAVKTLARRGRNAKQVPAALPPTEPQPEEEPVPVQAARPRRGAKAVEEKVEPKKGQVSKKTKPAAKDPEPSAAVEDDDDKASKAVNWKEDLTETREIPPLQTPVLKATRGRRAAVAPAPEAVAPKAVAKRKVPRGPSKAEEDLLSDVSLPAKRTRKATKDQHEVPAGVESDPATELVSADAPAEKPELVVASETTPQEALPQPRPEEEEAEILPAEQDVVLIAQEPPTKSVRGKRARITKPAADVDLATPVRGRRGRLVPKTPAQVEEPAQAEEPATMKSTRGKPAKSKVATGLTEVPQEETSVKSRRGRNAKQEPAVEAVPETTTAEEANQQAPPTDAVQSDAAAAIPAVPAVKTLARRGRNAKQVPAALPPTEPQPEEEPVPVQAARPRRGAKAVEEKVEPKKGQVSKKTKPAAKDPEPLATVEDDDDKASKAVNWKEDLTETREIPPLQTPVLKATRGRRAAVAPAPEAVAPKAVAKIKVSRGPSKAEEDLLSDVSLPAKRTRKATKVL
ncbi:hypothetical protein CRUP_001823, partial [Coryphaenoides rupestris]